MHVCNSFFFLLLFYSMLYASAVRIEVQRRAKSSATGPRTLPILDAYSSLESLVFLDSSQRTWLHFESQGYQGMTTILEPIATEVSLGPT
jgi:hypothetical protein